MKDHSGGSIVNLGSGRNKLAFPSLVAYIASKGTIEMFTKEAAVELGQYGIRVNCLAPGSIESERTRQEDPDYAGLDESCELAPAIQSKLLRAIQERMIERLGRNAPFPRDIRLIAATSRNLEQAVEEGEFREDVCYRLNVITIQLPPLRERRQDIPALVQHFLNRGGRKASITPQALAMLYEHHWPGNVRELEKHY